MTLFLAGYLTPGVAFAAGWTLAGAVAAVAIIVGRRPQGPSGVQACGGVR